MRYDGAEVEVRLRAGEDSDCEFQRIAFSGDRPSDSQRADWADEIAAFANANGGVLLCGVTDVGEVQGMSGAQIAALDDLLVEASTDAIKPPVRIATYHRTLEGKRFLQLEVPRGDAQHDSPGGSYLRVGASKRLMTSDERLRLAQRRGQRRIASFDERTVPDTGFRTLDESLWKPLLSTEGAADPEAALTRQALLGLDDAGVLRATVAGVLLCTPDPERWIPGASIAATCYRGRGRASGQLDAQEITGSLPQQIAGAVSFAVRNMRVAARKEPERVDLPQYSEQALFEAVVNAVVHRDYSLRRSRIRLSMFQDRLELQSPGVLPNNLTVAGMKERQVTRNEALASVLGRVPVVGVRGSSERHYFMERRGDGVAIILRRTREVSGRPAEYQLVDDSDVRLTIPAAELDESAARTVITVRSGGRPLTGAEVLVLFPNRTWKHAVTDTHGEASMDLHTTTVPLIVFAAAPGHAARRKLAWIPAQGALAIELNILPGGGSLVFPEATGRVPGLKGRLNPILDDRDRAYLYADNIAINEGQPQPVHFLRDEDLRLTDSDGRTLLVRIVDIVGRSALIEYRPPNETPQ